VRDLCSQSKKGRRIEWSPQHEALQQRKRQDPVKRELLRRLKVIVEPVFGILKQGEGFRRWIVRGLENVRTQWALVCTAYNLTKLWKAWQERLAGSNGNIRTHPSAIALVPDHALPLPCSTLRFEF
jgi:hypothetical protein